MISCKNTVNISLLFFNWTLLSTVLLDGLFYVIVMEYPYLLPLEHIYIYIYIY